MFDKHDPESMVRSQKVFSRSFCSNVKEREKNGLKLIEKSHRIISRISAPCIYCV